MFHVDDARVSGRVSTYLESTVLYYIYTHFVPTRQIFHDNKATPHLTSPPSLFCRWVWNTTTKKSCSVDKQKSFFLLLLVVGPFFPLDGESTRFSQEKKGNKQPLIKTMQCKVRRWKSFMYIDCHVALSQFALSALFFWWRGGDWLQWLMNKFCWL